MNKSYRSIWNETTRSWVAVPETAKGRGKRASARIAVTIALLGVIESNAWAVTTIVDGSNSPADDFVVTSGNIQAVRNGGVTNRTTVNNSGAQYVSGGGSANGTVLNFGGKQYVSSGGVANNTVISNGGTLQVLSSGGADGVVVHQGGTLDLAYSGGQRSATNVVVSSGGSLQAVVDTQVTVSGTNRLGSFYIDAATRTASNVVLEGANYYSAYGALAVMNGAQAIDITIGSNGVLTVLGGGSATGVNQLSGGGFSAHLCGAAACGGKTADVSGNNVLGSFYIDAATHTASGVLVEGGGTLSVSSGAVALDTTVRAGGSLRVFGGTATGVVQSSGGALEANLDGVVTGSNRLGSFYIDSATRTASGVVLERVTSTGNPYGATAGLSVSAGQASDTLVGNNGKLSAENGGLLISSVVSSGGLVTINSGGEERYTSAVSQGRIQVFSGGVSNSAFLTSYGSMAVSTGGVANGATVISSGDVQVLNGGVANSSVVFISGKVTVSNGGAANATTIDGWNGSQVVNGFASGTIVKSGAEVVSGGGVTRDTTISGGNQWVLLGGIASGTTVDGGTQVVYSAGIANSTVLNSGGRLNVVAGGTATAVTQTSGGVLITNTNATVSGTNALGAFSVDSATHTASNVLLENGGRLDVLATGTATDTTVKDGGTLAISSSGVLTGTTLISGTGVLAGSTLTNNGNLVFDVSNNSTIGGVIRGSGSLTKNGGTTLTLTSANTYTGGTTINAGALTLSGGMASLVGEVTGSAGALFGLDAGAVHSGTIQTVDVAVNNVGAWLATADASIGALNGDGTVALASGSTLTLNPAAGANFAGRLTGAGSLVKAGAGVQILTGGNALAYTGSTTISGGVLKIDVDSATAGGLARTIILGGGWLDLSDGASQSDWANLVLDDQSNGAGGVIGSNDVVHLNGSSYTAAIGSGGAGGKDGVYVVKDGAGETVIGGADKDYVGYTRIDEGTLTVSQDGHLGSTTVGREVIFNGGRLKIAGSFDTARDIGLQQSAILDVTAGNSTTWSGNVYGVGGGSLPLDKTGDGALTLTGRLDVGGVRHRSGALVLSGTMLNAQNDALTLVGLDALTATVDGATVSSVNGTLFVADSATNTGNRLAIRNTTINAPLGAAAGSGALISAQNGSHLDVNVDNATLTGDIYYDAGSTGTIALANNTRLTGKIDPVALSVDASSQWTMTADSQITTLTNNGKVIFQAPATAPADQASFIAKTLTVNNIIGGAGSEIGLNAWLGDTNGGTSDKLVVDGGAVTGTTTLALNAVGGLGAQTSGDGITVVEGINGADTTAQTTKNGFSLKGGKTVAGAYEYRLFAGDAAGAGQNWYLRSQLYGTGGGTPTYRPEAPLQAGVGNMARSLSQMTLSLLDHDEALWGRALANRVSADSHGVLASRYDGAQGGLQIGTDVQRWARADGGQASLGVYGAALTGHYTAHGNASGIKGTKVGKVDLTGYAAGVYARWQNANGLRVDGILQGVRFSGTASGDSRLDQQGTSLAASLEAAYPLPLSANLVLEPQVQLIHEKLNVDDASMPGAQVKTDADDVTTGRLGLRLRWTEDDGNGRRWQPWLGADLIGQTAAKDRLTFGTGSTQSSFDSTWGGGTALKASGGFSYRLKERLTANAQLGYTHSLSGEKRSEVSGTVGFSYSF